MSHALTHFPALIRDIWGSIDVIGMLLNFAVAIGVARFTSAPPVEVARLVDNIRVPRGS